MDLAQFQLTPEVDLWTPDLERKTKWRGGKGLPDRGDLFKLAAVWLETQRKLWPRLAEAGVLPPASPEKVAHLAGQYVVSFMDKHVATFVVPAELKAWKHLGTSYLRYSSTQQNPRSLDDQLTLQLRRAHVEDVFIPWEYVFADAAVTGVVNNRIGYGLCKSLISRDGPGAIDVIFVDELSRASRDGIETLLLGTLVRDRGKTIIGVSDGFDSRDESARMKLHFFAMFNEQFVTQHRQRVIRGRDGARRRGGVVGKVPLGLKAVPVVDGTGLPVRGRQGRTQYTYAIDEGSRHIIELLATRFVDERKSIHKICREFNALRLAGRTSWQPCTLLKMLRSRTYAGILVYNSVKHVVDPLTGKHRLVPRPQKDWGVMRLRHCVIFPWKRWKQIQARLAEVSDLAKQKYAGRSKNHVYPTRLFSGTLFCGGCESELILFRSSLRDASYYCRNGRMGARGCTLRSSKSSNQIEPALLAHIRREVLTEARIEQLVGLVNAAINEESAKPTIDVTPLRERSLDLRQKRDRLIALIENDASPDLAAIRSRIAVLESQAREVDGQLRQADASRAEVAAPVDVAAVKALLPQMREVLNQDVAIAAPALRLIFGKIRLYRATEDPRGPWIAKFRSNVLLLADHVAKKNGPPSGGTGDGGDETPLPDPLPQVNLMQRIWKVLPLEEVHIEREQPFFHNFAEQAMRLADEGLTMAEIGCRLGISVAVAARAEHLARHGASANQARYRAVREQSRARHRARQRAKPPAAS